MSRAYYNEIDPYAAQWLRNLIAAGLIAPGDVDERSIADVHPNDLVGYEQCHFFAGIGGWSYALRLAGWDGPAWTGSCPCQPLSGAGQRKGHADERHLWPAFYRLIAECRPAIVFGEQVASKDGREWLAGVRADLEGLGYGVGAADLCAAGVGAPHIRQRLFWLADADQGQRRRIADGKGRKPCRATAGWVESNSLAKPGSLSGGLADADGRQPGHGHIQRGGKQRQQPQDGGVAGGLGDPSTSGLPAPERESMGGPGRRQEGRAATEPGLSPAGGLGDPAPVGWRKERPVGSRGDQGDRPQGSAERSWPGFWSGADWLLCLDGKARRTEPGVFPLAHGVSGRVGRLRGYGNAIVPQVAAEFVSAYMETAAIGRSGL